MKRIQIILLFLTTIFCIQAQNMMVESFSLLPQDLTANVEGTSRFDPNTRKNAALIKVETTVKGLHFFGGLGLGLVGDPVNKISEVWVYVPEGAKKITIEHAELGTLRDYYYPESILSGKTYLMKLKTGKVITYVEQDLGGGYLTLIVEPKNSEVLIDGKTMAVDAEGGVSTFLPYGEHQYEVSAKMHKKEVGNITISSDAVKKNISLAPDYSIFQINTNPQGATVYIDDENCGTTPLTTSQIKTGEHTLRFTLPMYNSKTIKYTASGNGVTQTITETLQPDFSTITITAPGQAEIYINNEKKGSGRWEGKLVSGTYLLEARKPSHLPYKTTVTVESGKTQTITMQAPTPQYGTLNVQSTPTNASVLIDGKEVGTTPGIFRNILAGEREVTIKKEGYETLTKNIIIDESKVQSENLNLQKKQEQQPIEVTQPKDNKTITVNNYTETIKGLNLQMVYVEGGTFTMGVTFEQGSDAYVYEKPAHKVTLSSYYIGKLEVTQAQWRAIMGENPSKFTGDNNPVESVSWYEAQEFCKKLSELTGKKYRLPTEAEWEYAARGGNKSKGYKYSGSNTIDDVAWYWDNSGKTHPVGQKQPNELGLYDMSGNVWEWCSDWYGDYTSTAQTNPTGPTSGSYRVHRGGSWRSSVKFCRVSNRGGSSPGDRGRNIGFRLASDL